jgi:hypothetical protein
MVAVSVQRLALLDFPIAPLELVVHNRVRDFVLIVFGKRTAHAADGQLLPQLVRFRGLANNHEWRPEARVPFLIGASIVDDRQHSLLKRFPMR